MVEVWSGKVCGVGISLEQWLMTIALFGGFGAIFLIFIGAFSWDSDVGAGLVVLGFGALVAGMLLAVIVHGAFSPLCDYPIEEPLDRILS